MMLLLLLPLLLLVVTNSHISGKTCHEANEFGKLGENDQRFRSSGGQDVCISLSAIIHVQCTCHHVPP